MIGQSDQLWTRSPAVVCSEYSLICSTVDTKAVYTLGETLLCYFGVLQLSCMLQVGGDPAEQREHHRKYSDNKFPHFPPERRLIQEGFGEFQVLED